MTSIQDLLRRGFSQVDVPKFIPSNPLTQPGAFGAIRKHDIHTGVDLYLADKTEIIALTSGIICKVEQFTGAAVGSPWWNDTWAVHVRVTNDTIHVYGELAKPMPVISPGLKLHLGETIGHVTPVLKTNKGTPTCMLHFESYKNSSESIDTDVWNLGEPKPKDLEDPTSFLADHLWWLTYQVGDVVALKAPRAYHGSDKSLHLYSKTSRNYEPLKIDSSGQVYGTVLKVPFHSRNSLAEVMVNDTVYSTTGTFIKETITLFT